MIVKSLLKDQLPNLLLENRTIRHSNKNLEKHKHEKDTKVEAKQAEHDDKAINKEENKPVHKNQAVDSIKDGSLSFITINYSKICIKSHHFIHL